MIKEAESNAEEDKKIRELVDAKNQAEAIIHSAEKGVIDAGDKITDDERLPVEEAVKELKDVLESEDLAVLQEKTATLSQAAMKIGEKLYQEEQAAAEASNGSGENNNSDDADIVDADYEEVKEEEEAKEEEAKEEEAKKEKKN